VDILCAGAEVKDLVIAKGASPPSPASRGRQERGVDSLERHALARSERGGTSGLPRPQRRPHCGKGCAPGLARPRPGPNIMGELIKPPEAGLLHQRLRNGVTM
jgi:hypothetical protein